MNVLLAIDSYKGCATSEELASWVEEGILAVMRHATVKKCLIADGGEGMLEAILHTVQGRRITCKVHDPLMNLIEAEYGILDDEVTAVIEMAQASGLPLVPLSQRNPLITTTYGVGELMKDALEKGCRRIILGIGGSATNDAGLGMLQALGYQFFDAQGELLGQGGAMLEAFHSLATHNVLPALRECEIVVACDVDNVMYGSHGCAQVYAAQKGATQEMIQRLDKGMIHFTQRLQTLLGVDVALVAGSGAAGGMGGGLWAFLGAKLQPGIEILLDQMQFDTLLNEATLVITGEGRIDAQSLMGKVLSGVSKRAKRAGVPLIALGGGIDDSLNEHENVDALFSIMRYPMSLEEAMEKERAKTLVIQTTKEIFRLINALIK